MVIPTIPEACSERAVFLDRDGVLNIPEFRDGRSFAPHSVETFRLYSDAVSSVAALKRAGFLVIVATNQPDAGAGHVAREAVEAMHMRLRSEIAIDDLEVCYETREQSSDRRKPGIGMLRSAAAKWGIDLSRSFMVGDRASDIECALNAGCTGIFIDLGYTELLPVGQAVTVQSLGAATNWILRNAASKLQVQYERREEILLAK